MNINLVDIIGSHSGTHYYNNCFRNVLHLKYKSVRIISNYNDPENESVAILKNYYEGLLVIKILKLIQSIFSFYLYVLKNRKSVFVFQSFGNAYEILFILILIFSRSAIIDCHEVISLIDGNLFVRKIRSVTTEIIYKYLTDAVIIHSERSETILAEIGYAKPLLAIPHFSYLAESEPDDRIIPEEVKSLISKGKLNILFFGQMRFSKGIETVLSLAGRISDSRDYDGINLIIAGSDSKHLIEKLISINELKGLKSVSVLIRYITDIELRYLFSRTNYVFLPYKEVSQSGVMEMAFTYRKPVITSPLGYFRNVIYRFPSFGISAGSHDVGEYLEIFKMMIDNDGLRKKLCFNDQDIQGYISNKNPEKFLTELEIFLNI